MIIQPLLFGTFGLQEILIIALVVLLFFGGKKIPELMKGLGKGVRSFKDGMKEVDPTDEVKSEEAKEETKA
jgi:sec-independent protein translocase protein TatA